MAGSASDMLPARQRTGAMRTGRSGIGSRGIMHTWSFVKLQFYYNVVYRKGYIRY